MTVRQRLRSCERFLEDLVDGIHVVDAKGILVDFSESFAQGLGYDLEELEGRHVSVFDASWTDSKFSEILRVNAPSSEKITTIHSLHRHKNGTPFPVELKVRSVMLDGQSYLIAMSRNVSGRSHSEMRTRRMSELNILLASAGAAVSEARDEGLFLQTLCDLCVRHGDMSLAWVGYPGSEGLFVFKAAAGSLFYLDNLRISTNGDDPEGRGPSGLAFRESRPFFNNNFDDPFLSPWKERAERFEFRSNAALPILHEGRVWGILSVYHREKNAFSEEIQDLLTELSRIISRGFTLVTNRRIEKETALLQEALLDNTLAGIALVRENRFIMANARFRELFGFMEQDLEKAEVCDLFVGNRIPFPELSNDRSRTSGKLHLFTDIPVRRMDGREFYVDLSARPLSESETTVWTIVDVSERHALQEKNTRISRFNLMLARANESIAIATDEGTLLRELCEIAVKTGDLELACIGIPDEEGWIRILASAGKKDFLEGVRYSVLEGHAEGKGAVGLAWRTSTSQFNETFAAQSIWKDRARAFGFRSGGALPVMRNGKVWGVFFVYYRRENVLQSDLKVILEDLVNNVSRGLDLLELQHFRSLLSRALAAVSDGAVVTGTNRKVLFSNKAFSEITGYAPGEVSGMEPRLLLGLGSDMAVQLGIERAIFAGETFEGEILHYRKDGSPFWNHLSITPIKNESGTLTHFVEIHRDVTQVKQMAERLSFESRHDDLTGLPNRRSLESHLDRILARAGRHGTAVAIGVLDLNNFKPVNDLHGHEAGDVLLRDFAKRVRSKLRESDFLARLGGDEFVLVVDDLPRDVSDENLGSVLERLHEAVETPFTLPSGETAIVGMSLGVVLFPDDGLEGDELLRKADLSMYGVKERKRRGISWWQRGVEKEQAEEDISFDPYSSDTMALLNAHRGELLALQERFVEDFYRTLSSDSDAQTVLDILSREDLESLKVRPVHYLTDLLRPDESTESRREWSRQVGEAQALTGVPENLLLRLKFHYSRLLIDHLNRSRLSSRDRLHLYLALDIRLDRELEMHIDAAKATIDRYFGVLSLPRSNNGAEDKLSFVELERLSILPGIRAVLFLEFQNPGLSKVSMFAGDCGEPCRDLFGKGESEGQRPFYAIFDAVSKAWDTKVSKSLKSLISGAGPSPGEAFLKNLALRSFLAIPITGGSGPSGILCLFGRYPNQFESSWMQRFAIGVARRTAGFDYSDPST